ncbi:MAG: hypothetical protein JRN32_01765 [Nitrososphaerota archaeon]|jgi:hypothetical protein|nr:hypothetical protein [Nitrososphaerota archaeon]
MLGGIIYHTSKDWLDYLIEHNLTDEVSFWTSRKTRLDIDGFGVVGQPIPFFFKTEDEQLVGVGNYIRQETLTLEEAWSKYGRKNGVDTKEALLESAAKILRTRGTSSRMIFIILGGIRLFRQPIKPEGIKLKNVLYRQLDRLTASAILEATRLQ